MSNQFKAMLRKNFLVLKRNPIKTAIQLMFPIGIILLCSCFPMIGEPTDEKSNLKDLYLLSLNSLSSDDANVLKYYLMKSNMSIIGTNSTVVNELRDYMSLNDSAICFHPCRIATFQSEKELLAYLSLENKNKINITEVIHIIEGHDKSISFKVSSQLVTRRLEYQERSVFNTVPGDVKNYYLTTLQVYLSKFLIKLNQKGTLNRYYPINLYPMKSQKLVTNEAFGIAHSFIYALIACSYIGVLFKFSLWIISEKENKQLDLLRRQGIGRVTYALTWLCTFCIVNFVPMILSVALLFFYNFRQTSIICLMITLFLFFINIITFGLFFSSLVHKVSSSQGLLVLLYIGTSILSIAVNRNETSLIVKYFFYIFPPVVLTTSLEFLFLSMNFKQGMDINLIFEFYKGTNMFLLYMMSCATFIIYILLHFLCDSYHSHSGLSCAEYILSFYKPIRRNGNMKKECEISISEHLIENDEPIQIITSTESRVDIFNRSYEEVTDENLRMQIEKKEHLSIDSVFKNYHDVQALKNFSCNLFHGQIFVLLGQNGAGKSTLLKIISGIEYLDKGDVLMDDHSLITEKEFLYTNIGLCEQDDIFFNDITVREHLEIMKMIKGQDKDKDQDEITTLIDQLGLTEQQNDLAQNLSGGQKRKLCIGLALIGNSKLILLDEPTSGMDIFSKKAVCDFLKQYKKNKIIILTTHSIDEAEYLGDTIGIISEGELICKGSSAFLKSIYPCGFNINFIIKGNEMTLQEKGQFIAEFKAIEPLTKIKVLGKDLIKLNFPDILDKEGNNIERIFHKIERIRDKYSIVNYTVATSSLEDVFFKVNDNEFTRNLFENELNQVICDYANLKYDSSDELDHSDILFAGKEKHYLNSDQRLSIKKLPEKSSADYIIEDILYQNSYCTQLRKHLKRHFLTLLRSKEAFFMQVLVSSFIFILALTFSNIFCPDVGIEYSNIKTLFQNRPIYYHLINSVSHPSLKVDMNYFKIDEAVNFTELVNSGFNLSNSNMTEYEQFLFDKFPYHEIKTHWVIINLNEALGVAVFYSSSSTDYKYASLNMILRAQLYQMYGIATDLLVEYGNTPVPKIAKGYEDFVSSSIMVAVLILTFVLFGTYEISLPLKEKVNHIKHLNYLNGGTTFIYWIAFYIFDYIKFSVFALLVYTIISYQEPWIWITIVVPLMFGFSSILQAYIFSFFFDQERYAWIFYFLFNYLLAQALNSIHAAISDDIFDFNFSFRITDLSPFTALGMHLQLIYNAYLQLQLTDISISFQSLQANACTVFLIQSAAFVLILIMLEKRIFSKCIHNLRSRNSRNLSSHIGSRALQTINEYAIHEKEKIMGNKLLPVKIQDLVAIYRNCCTGSVTAVNKLFLGLEKNETFGMLGFNGSGKSTTFKAITNEIFLDSGKIEIFGKNTQSEFGDLRKILGYCPQANSLFDFLTVKETFDFYWKGQVKNMRTKDDCLNDIMKQFGLIKYKNCLTSHLSGGNKRKLSFAIALLNNPQLVLLDEPSTGIDPDSRRLMWKNINEISRVKKCLNMNFNMILSTHSIEEAEILCDTIGWMKAGNFACLGNSEQLKLKYSDGYYFTIKFNKPSEELLSEMDISFESFPALDRIFGVNVDDVFDYVADNKPVNQRSFEEFYYFKKLNDISGLIMNSVEKMSLLNCYSGTFNLLIYVKPELQGYLFSGLLNLKNLDTAISEVSVHIQSLESFIQKL